MGCRRLAARRPTATGLLFSNGMTLVTRSIVVVLACAALVPFDVAAQENPSPADKTLSPYFFVQGGDPSVDRLPLKDTRVDVAITGVIADVTVRQVYENRGTRPIHARYVFPASTRAAVYGMTHDGRRCPHRGQNQGARESRHGVRSREARGEERVAPGAEPSQRLHDERRQRAARRHHRRRAQVHGAAGSDRRRVRVRVPDGGRPAVFREAGRARRRRKTGSSRRRTPTRARRRSASSTSRAWSSTGVPIQEIASPSHQVVFRIDRDGRTEMTLADAERALGQSRLHPSLSAGRRDDQLGTPALSRARTRTSSCSWRNRRRPSQPAEIPPREYIFVLDVSGSMHGFPLDTGKKLMRDLVNVLRPSDTFNVVVFADGTDTFSPRLRSRDAHEPHARAAVHRGEERRRRDAAAGGAPTSGGSPASTRGVAQRRAADRRLHRRRSGRVRLRPQSAGRRQLLRVRHRQQREPVPHRRCRACGARRTVHRHRHPTKRRRPRRSFAATSTRPCSPAST